MSKNLADIMREIESAPPEHQLRLAADLICQAKGIDRKTALSMLGIAHSITERVSAELGAVLLLANRGDA